MNFEHSLFLTKWKTMCTYFHMIITLFFLFCYRVSENSVRKWNSHKIFETLLRFWFRSNSTEGREFVFTQLWCSLRHRFFEVNNSRGAQKISQSASIADREDQCWPEVRCHLLLQQCNTPLQFHQKRRRHWEVERQGNSIWRRWHKHTRGIG